MAEHDISFAWDTCLEEIKTTLIDNDVDISEEQTFSFFLTFDESASAVTCRDRLNALSYPSSVEGPGPIFGDYLCLTVMTFSPLSQTMAQFLQQWMNICDMSGGRYDGWEVNCDKSAINATDYQNIAQELLETVSHSVIANHQFRTAVISDYSHLDRHFYTDKTAFLNILGFVLVCDIEDVTVSEAFQESTVIRVLRHPSTNVLVALYHMASSGLKVMEFETLFDDGKVVSHINIDSQNKLTDFPQVEQYFLPGVDDPAALFEEHVSVVNDYYQDSVLVDDCDKVIAMQNHMNTHKYDYLESVGWITREFLERQSDGNIEIVNGVYHAVQQLVSGQTFQQAHGV